MNQNIYKLQYDTKAQGDADLLAKGTYEVVEGEQVYINGTQAIVYIGLDLHLLQLLLHKYL